MIKSIAVAVDGSEHAYKALDMAAEVAGQSGGALTIVHALMHGRPAEEFTRMAEVEHLVPAAMTDEKPHYDPANMPAAMAEMMAGNRRGDEIDRLMLAIADQLVWHATERAKERGVGEIASRIETGDYADAIIKAAEDVDADLIVVGSRGLGTIREWVLGSVSHKVCQSAPCSVLVAK